MDTFLRFSHKVDTLGAVFENSKPRDQIDLQIPGYPVTLSVKGYEPQTEWESSACLALHFELIQEFHDRSLAKSVQPVLLVDVLYEKVRINSRIVSTTVLGVCGVDENGHRDITTVAPMAEKSENSYRTLFKNLERMGYANCKACDFECPCRYDCCNSEVLSQCFLASAQGAFHAEYSSPHSPEG